jgi:hypothetical protein
MTTPHSCTAPTSRCTRRSVVLGYARIYFDVSARLKMDSGSRRAHARSGMTGMGGVPRRVHSVSFTPASTMIFAAFADSPRMNSRYCSGVFGAGSKPIALNFAAMSGIFNT